jgi:hypothetical protein
MNYCELIQGIIIVLLIGGCCLSATGQGKARMAEIKGRVADGRTGTALAGASVFALDTSAGTLSDSRGRFALTLAYGTYMIVVSLPGYRDAEIEIEVDASLSGEIFEVMLDPETGKSDETPVSVPVQAGNVEGTGGKRIEKRETGRQVSSESVGRGEAGKTEVKGGVTDGRTGRMLSGVSVFALDTSVGTVSDDGGAFVLTLAGGKYTLVAALPGYINAEFELKVDASLSGKPLKVTLNPEPGKPDMAVVADTAKARKATRDPETGKPETAVVAERVAVNEIKRLPVASASVQGNVPDAGRDPVRTAMEQSRVEKTDDKARATDGKARKPDSSGGKTEIKGTVTDANTGTGLAGASILTLDTSEGAVSNNEGRFVIPLARGKHTIVVSFVGYQDAEIEVTANDSSANAMLDVTLDPAAEELEAVVISTTEGAKKVRNVNMGVERLTIKEIQRLPVLMGEVDVLKAIQRLPGVQPAAEGGSGFSVRGGSPDQNLILLDNATVYNASHLMGFFSVFNNDVVGGLELYKGDLPLKYGGRLSSLLSVHGKTEMPQHGLQGSGGIGLIATRLTLEGAIGSRTSWILGGRRSYADIFLPLSKDESLRNSSIYFYDMNAKLTHRFTNGDRLELNGYYGGDRFGSDIGKFRYGNFAASLGWRHIFSPSSRSRISFNISDYSYNVASNLESVDATWDAGIRDYTLQADFDHDIGGITGVNYGITSTFHRFNPGHVTVTGYADYEVQGGKAIAHAIYLSNEHKLTDRFTLRYGLRLSMFMNMGEQIMFLYDEKHKVRDSIHYAAGNIYNTYIRPEPRAGMVFMLGGRSSLKANYARNVQFVQLAENSSAGSPVNVWFPVSPNIKPQTVDMYSAGYFRNFGRNVYEVSFEAYYKKLSGVIDFAEHAQLLLNPYLEGDIRTGDGQAYGMELMLKKNSGKLTGFFNYTLSRSERTIPEINGGKTYLAPFDKTHAVNIAANYEFSAKLHASASWVFSTGTPTTYPTGRFEINGEYFPIYSGRNEYRKPAYHRLDLSLTYIPHPYSVRRWKSEWNISLYNAYGRKNPWLIRYSQVQSSTPQSEMTYLFRFVPSLTYNFKF